MSEVKKVIRDGKVAVLYSPGYGAGWSSWANNNQKDIALYHPDIVAWVEGGKKDNIEEIMERLIGEYYAGGAYDLKIEWLPIGTLFRIREYDGHETLEIKEEMDWEIA